VSPDLDILPIDRAVAGTHGRGIEKATSAGDGKDDIVVELKAMLRHELRDAT
jgi:hypothetical protein